MKRTEIKGKLFTQVIEASQPQLLKLWEKGSYFISKKSFNCPEEIIHEKNIGKSYYQCNPHFWQCYWSGGVVENPSLEVELAGSKYHVYAKQVFSPIKQISPFSRYYELFKRTQPDFELDYGLMIELGVRELPGVGQRVILAETCRDTFLPQRVYGYGKPKEKNDNGFIWDNFDRNIFIDRFYVTNRQVNEWKILNGQLTQLNLDRKQWPKPALLNWQDQVSYCSFFGKRVLEAKLFDAATMSPTDISDTKPKKLPRPGTPWQRDVSKTFLGMARINPDFQLTPLDCQLAQVQGCAETFFSTDSATWMGFHYSLGFYSESVRNFISPEKNLKISSRHLPPSSPLHELGLYSSWEGVQKENLPVAFRCYEEVSP